MSSIVTFYSFKGGVGRTMALANIAILLARSGKKVLAVDFDLEAPGLDKYFKNLTILHADKEKRGLLNLLNDAQSSNKPDWKSYLSEVYFDEKTFLTLLTSGRQDYEENQKEYAKKLFDFDWNRFFQEFNGGQFIEDLRNEWLKHYDIVLVDSRTGITDSGGVCTIQLPDILVLVFTANEQSLMGAKEIAISAQMARQKLAYDRTNLLIFPLPSDIDLSEYVNVQDVWMERFAEELKLFYEDWMPKDIPPRQMLDRTRLPYVPFFSFGEQLPVIIEEVFLPDRAKVSKSLGEAYLLPARLIENDFRNTDELLLGSKVSATLPLFSAISELKHKVSIKKEGSVDATHITIVRVFISSPGDVEPERAKVTAVAAQVNRMLGDSLGIVLEVVDWKTHVVPDMGRPQEVINQKVGDYDIFVGILWKHFGTPTGKAESGTEEEFNIAYANWQKYGRPIILFYFNTAAYSPKDISEAEQWMKVLSFKVELQRKAGLIRDYQTAEEFSDLLREHLIKVLSEWFKPKKGSAPVSIIDFTAYLKYLRQETMSIDIRGLVTGKGKIHQFPIDELYIPLRTRYSVRESREMLKARLDEDVLLQEALQERRLFIKGDPGSGKTTFLRLIAYTLCQGRLGEATKSRLSFAEPVPLPLLIRVGALSRYISQITDRPGFTCPAEKDSPKWLLHYLDSLSEEFRWKLTKESFSKELEEGHCMILLDGLDEAPSRQVRVYLRN